jgi:hypothetical protein
VTATPAPLPYDAVLDGTVTGPTVRPSGPVHLALRLLLLAAFGVGLLGAVQHPVERSVDVQTAEALPSTVPLGLSVTTAVLLVLVTFGTALVLLVAGPEPRLATRWAWFWLTVNAWPVWLAYALLEPTPAWSRRTVIGPVRRLTGGWAFLGQLLLAPLLMRALTGS